MGRSPRERLREELRAAYIAAFMILVVKLGIFVAVVWTAAHFIRKWW